VRNPPSREAIEKKVREIFNETLEPDGEVAIDRPLIAELGYDSLDMIELSFALEEFFGFEFNSRNAIEELDRRLGKGRILADGVLNDLGRQVVLERMPELGEVDLPAELRAAALPQYFPLRTFARIIEDFYARTPDTCAESGENVVSDGFRIVAETSREEIPAPSGDAILEEWLERKATELGSVRSAD